MKVVLMIFLCLVVLLPLAGQDITIVLKEADLLEYLPNEQAAFAKYKEVLKLQPTNQYALNKCSELCSRIGKRQTNPKLIEDYFSAAKAYAGIALKINPANSESNCVMAIALGRTSLNRSGKEKINSAKEIKKYVDAALKNDPKNFKAWHVLGRWNYEVSNLNMFERSAVRIFYGGLPDASLSESIRAFEKSQSITDGFILNYYEMAKAYKRADQTAKAIALLTKMLTIKNQTEDDPVTKDEGKKLLNEWQ